MSGVKGRSGRRPIPDEIKKLNGTFREDRAPESAVVFPVKVLHPPDYVNADNHALAEWDRVVPLLNAVKILTEPDLTALASYCMACSVAVRAAMAVTVEPLTVVAGNGGLKPNPNIAIASEARAQALRFMVEFGLTPAARSRVAGQKTEKPLDPAADFLFHPPQLVKTA